MRVTDIRAEAKAFLKQVMSVYLSEKCIGSGAGGGRIKLIDKKLKLTILYVEL